MRLIFMIDHLSTWVGKLFAWAILILTFVVSYEVFMRYALGAPTTWAYDTSYMLYGTLFMMSGALCPCPQRPRASRRGLPLLPGACPGQARARALPGVLLPGHPGPALLRLGLLRHLLPPERTQLLHSRGAADLALQVRDPRLCGNARPAGARRGGPLPGLPEARQLATPPG